MEIELYSETLPVDSNVSELGSTSRGCSELCLIMFDVVFVSFYVCVYVFVLLAKSASTMHEIHYPLHLCSCIFDLNESHTLLLVLPVVVPHVETTTTSTAN